MVYVRECVHRVIVDLPVGHTFCNTSLLSVKAASLGAADRDISGNGDRHGKGKSKEPEDPSGGGDRGDNPGDGDGGGGGDPCDNPDDGNGDDPGGDPDDPDDGGGDDPGKPDGGTSSQRKPGFVIRLMSRLKIKAQSKVARIKLKRIDKN